MAGYATYERISGFSTPKKSKNSRRYAYEISRRYEYKVSRFYLYR